MLLSDNSELHTIKRLGDWIFHNSNIRYWVKKNGVFVNLNNIDEIRVFIRSLFNINDFDMCSVLRKKMCFWHTLLRSSYGHNPRELRARFFPHNEYIHTNTFTKMYIAPSRGHRAKRRKRGCKAYPCRSLWRRVAITGSFIHCTPLTSSLGRSFTLLPSPGITRQSLPTVPRSSTTLHTLHSSPRYRFHPYLNDVTVPPLQRGMSSPSSVMQEG